MLFSLIGQANSDETRLLILVVGLAIIAVMLSGLTLWYWRYTDPKRYVQDQQVVASRVGSERNPVANPRSKADVRVKRGVPKSQGGGRPTNKPIDLDQNSSQRKMMDRSSRAAPSG